MTQRDTHFTNPLAGTPFARAAVSALLICAILCWSGFAIGQSTEDAALPGAASAKDVSEMSAEELAEYIKEQELQLEAVKQARDAQKAKAAEVQEALIDRQDKLNQIVIELSELCSQRKELDPDDTEPCLPEES